ncbi:hypothetical protein [Streptomyces sp. NPDC059649]|uniref:hypothetical protein n=1 Tax=Streptomyces sp. NPDC059649 TaxID=3346895 RepID=UPI0036C4EF9F
MDITPVGLAKEAIERALAITEPAVRARAITDIIKAVEDDARLKSTRKADVLLLRETLTLREVSEKVGLSIGRVDQIAKGTVTGRRSKTPREDA